MHPQQQIDPSQLKTSLQLAESEMKLHEFRLAAYRERAKKERGFIAALARKQLDGDEATNQIVAEYLRAHKGHTDADANIMELELAKIKGRAALMQATLEDLTERRDGPIIIRPENKLVVPGAR